MRHLRISLVLLLASLGLLHAEAAHAERYSLWIHGRNTAQSTQPGNYADFASWGAASMPAGVNKRAVNWDGVSRISVSNYRIRNALDCFCTGANWCYIAAHSAGDLQIGYALSLYGGSTRSIKNASPDGSGVCGSAGGTQTGWNIKWIDIASGGGGGSELANLGEWAVSDPLTTDLKTANARSLYNHNQTQGITFYMFAGAQGGVGSSLLPGQDDNAVAYHSTGGLSDTGSFCNPGNWFCDDALEYGSTGSYKGSTYVAKWANHYVWLRDDGEDYDHTQDGAWADIVGEVREDMALYAY